MTRRTSWLKSFISVQALKIDSGLSSCSERACSVSAMADMLKAVTTESAERRGALFYQLCTHLNWIDLYPINPHSLSSFRLTFFSSRAKDDPIDSQLLEELLRTHHDRLRPYQPEATTERKLYLYCRQRRSLLDIATKAELKLVSTLKQYFPVTVSLFTAIGMKSDIALDFLSRWPTLHHLRRAKVHTVRSSFYAHNSHRVNVPIKIHDHFRRHSSNSAILLSTSGSKRWLSMVMADDENSDFVGKRRGTESDKGNRRKFSLRISRSPTEKDVASLRPLSRKG